MVDLSKRVMRAAAVFMEGVTLLDPSLKTTRANIGVSARVVGRAGTSRAAHLK